MFRRVLNRNSGKIDNDEVRIHSAPASGEVPLPNPPTRVGSSFSSPRQNPLRKRGRRPGRRNQQHESDDLLQDRESADKNRMSHFSLRTSRQHRVSALSGGGPSVISAAEDLMSIQSTITIETTRTSFNENRKPIPTFSQVQERANRTSHQLFCNSKNVLHNLKNASHDNVVTHLYFKDVAMRRDVCSAFLTLMRGDNKSWDSFAVDILRQRARWDSITFEECQNSEKQADINRPSRIVLPQTHQQEQYMEICISFILSIDTCAELNLSNLYLEQPFTLQPLTFSKKLVKLQFDLMDLSPSISTLCHCLPQNQSLEVLIASRCGLNDHQLAALMGSLPDCLLELRVFGNKCRAQGLAAASILIQEHRKIQILDLSYQHLPRKELKQEGLDIVEEKKRAEKNEDEAFDISWLMAALMSNTTLLTLDLDNTAIDDNDLRHIIQALCENTTLENIMLNHNFITNEGVAALAARFNEMTGLKKISMYSNLFDEPTMAPPPTEITTPSIFSNVTQPQGNLNRGHQNSSIRRDSYGDDESSQDFDDGGGGDDDDDHTVNTAVSSLADETVFLQMESNSSILPGAVDDEKPQEPFIFPRSENQQRFDNHESEGEQHYFDDGKDYDESVAPTEYDEVSINTESDTKYDDASYIYGDPMDDDSIPPYGPDPVSQPPGADNVWNNTTAF